MTTNRLTVRLVLAAVLLTGFRVSAAYSADVYFGGFAYMGDAAAVTKNYPYSSALAAGVGGGPSEVERALTSRVSSIENPTFKLVFDRLGTLGPNSVSSIAVAFVLDRETVSVEKLAGVYKVLVGLSAEALFFDFREKAVLASFPVTVQYTDVKAREPTPEELQGVVRALYLGSLGVNILDDFTNALASASFNAGVTRRVQVTSVAVTDSAHAFLPPLFAADESNLKAMVGQEFSKFLSLNQHMPVLPFTAGQAIGNKMAARFADGTVYDLKIPEPDYAINLALANFKKLEFGKSAAGSSYVYGAFLGVKVLEPLSNKVYLDATIKNGATKIVPASQETVDDWPAFQESLLVLMDKLTQAISAPDTAWAEKYAGNKSVSADLEKLQKVLQSCR